MLAIVPDLIIFVYSITIFDLISRSVLVQFILLRASYLYISTGLKFYILFLLRTKATPVRDNENNNQAGVPPPEVREQKGDLLIRDLCQNGTDSVHDIHVVNTDSMLHRTNEPERCLQEAEMGEERMYLEACLHQRRNFSPFVTSVDGLLGVEATATLKRLASRLATKWKQPYSKMCEYVKSRIAINLVRNTHRCIRGSWVPAHRISVQQPQWEDGAGSKLFR